MDEDQTLSRPNLEQPSTSASLAPKGTPEGGASTEQLLMPSSFLGEAGGEHPSLMPLLKPINGEGAIDSPLAELGILPSDLPSLEGDVPVRLEEEPVIVTPQQVSSVSVPSHTSSISNNMGTASAEGASASRSYENPDIDGRWSGLSVAPSTPYLRKELDGLSALEIEDLGSSANKAPDSFWDASPTAIRPIFIEETSLPKFEPLDAKDDSYILTPFHAGSNKQEYILSPHPFSNDLGEGVSLQSISALNLKFGATVAHDAATNAFWYVPKVTESFFDSNGWSKGFFGFPEYQDKFFYTVQDAKGTTDSATISISIRSEVFTQVAPDDQNYNLSYQNIESLREAIEGPLPGFALRLITGSGADMLEGGPGNDRHFGGDGNDEYYGSGGSDIYIDEGKGDYNTLSYEYLTNSIKATISSPGMGTVQHADQTSFPDFFLNIQKIIGTPQDLDNFVVSSRTASTYMDGGAGALDSLTYSLGTTGKVTLTLDMAGESTIAKYNLSNVLQGTDKAVNFEQFLGTAQADTFNILSGSEDVIVPLYIAGGAGNDLFKFNLAVEEGSAGSAEFGHIQISDFDLSGDALQFHNISSNPAATPPTNLADLATQIESVSVDTNPDLESTRVYFGPDHSITFRGVESDEISTIQVTWV